LGWLCRLLERYGEKELNRIRDEARSNCSVLEMEKEFQALERLIGAILSTQSIEVLSTERAIAVAKKEPFDPNRIEIFASLAKYLRQCEFVSRPYQYSYLNGLRGATRSNKFRTITKVFSDLHGYTNSIEWGDYSEARATLETHLAHKLPDQGVAVFNRQISKYRIELPAG
jgi:hypothetical protein